MADIERCRRRCGNYSPDRATGSISEQLLSLTSFLLVVVAAALHAGWNLIVKASEDRLIAVWAVLAVGGASGAVILVFAGLPEASAIPWLVGSVAVHVVYPLTLVAAYDHADMSVAYPIVRGVSPVLVAIAGVALLDDSISRWGVVGILAITIGVMSLIGGRISPREAVWPLACGVSIAGYTVLDGGGVRAGGESLRFLAAVFFFTTIALTAVVVARRSIARMRRHLSAAVAPTILGGLASAGAYLLVLVAARTSPLGLVSALRETSAAFGVLGAVLVLRESVTMRQIVAVASIVTGASVVALS